MKVRNGFVSNSSSTSFTIDTSCPIKRFFRHVKQAVSYKLYSWKESFLYAIGFKKIEQKKYDFEDNDDDDNLRYSNFDDRYEDDN